MKGTSIIGHVIQAYLLFLGGWTLSIADAEEIGLSSHNMMFPARGAEAKSTNETGGYNGCPAGHERLKPNKSNVDEKTDVDSASNIPCRPCSAGQFLNVSSCTPCPPGEYSSYIASTKCVPCENGSVSFGGSTECVLCPSGAVATVSHDACTECEAGKWSLSGDTKCRVCEPGTYNSIDGKPGCVECGRGYYNPNAGSMSRQSCQPCPPGYACPDKITEKPTVCSDFEYSIRGANTCKKCPSLFRSSKSRTECEPTGPFYALVGFAALILLLCMACLLRCPSKDWARPGGVKGLSLGSGDAFHAEYDSDDLYEGEPEYTSQEDDGEDEALQSTAYRRL